MNIKKVLGFGLKILAAVGAGVCVFIGFGKTLEKKINNQKGNRSSPEDTIDNKQPNDQPRDLYTQPLPQVRNEDKTHKFITNMRKFQDTCGKLFSVAQSIATVVENTCRIFGNDNNNYYNNQGLPPGFTRISPNIVEVGYIPGSNYDRQSRYRI